MPFQTILSHIKLANQFLYSTLTYWGNLYFCIFFFSCSPDLAHMMQGMGEAVRWLMDEDVEKPPEWWL